MTDCIESAGVPAFKDRKVRLILFGILQLALGALCVLLVCFMILGMFMAASLNRDATTPIAPMNISFMIPGMLVYLLAAAWFISMGIGSIMTRRWARALVLVSSWLWLIGGIGGFAGVLVFMPAMYDQMGKTGQMPPGAIAIMKYVMMAFMALFCVIIPGLLVLFYSGKNVKATCEFRDSRVRWTDKCPLPVLAVSFLFGMWAALMPLMAFGMYPVPLFGWALTGWPATAVSLITALLFGYVAWGTYKLNLKAWWGAILLIIAWILSAGITFSRIGLLGFYEKMNFSPEQMDLMREVVPKNGVAMAAICGLWSLVILGYLVYTRRYFTDPS